MNDYKEITIEIEKNPLDDAMEILLNYEQGTTPKMMLDVCCPTCSH